MAPKKQQKMSIGDFLNDQSLGSWADEMDTQPLPSSSSGFGGERRAFSTTSSFGGDRFGSSAGGLSDRSRPFRDQLPLPSRPPYTAHLGNLSFETTEGDVQDLLRGCDVTSVRIVEDKMLNKPKGFGYVEFGTVDGLKKALDLSETQFQGRNIRISVAEPSKDRAETRELNDWTRKGPLPDVAGQGSQRTSERTGSFRGGFDAASDAGSDRGGRKGFFEGDGKTRDLGNWERRGPPAQPPAPESRQGGFTPRGPPEERRSSPAWGEGRSDAGSRPPRPDRPERPERPERTPTAADMDSQWRSRMRPDQPSPLATPDASVPSSPQTAAAPAAPASRPRLNLAKRTVSEAPVSADGSSGGSSIFGGAKPVDTQTREAEIEKKQREAAAAKKEAEDKAREEKKAREAASKAERVAATAAAEKDEKRDSPRENGKPAERKGSDAISPPPGKQYEILRRMDEEIQEEATDRDAPDASANGDIVQDKETKPQEVVREVPVDAAGAQPSSEPSSKEIEDDGFTVVGEKKKKGRAAANRALAS